MRWRCQSRGGLSAGLDRHLTQFNREPSPQTLAVSLTDANLELQAAVS